MNSPVLEPVERLQNMLYLHRHKQEDPFPLNGTEWARLVSERLDRERHPCLCHSCFNLLTKLHSNESPLRRERKGVMRAMHYWFLQGQSTYTSNWLEQKLQDAGPEFAAEIREPATPMEELGVPHGLMDAEKAWLRENVQAARVNLIEGVKSTCAVEDAGKVNDPIAPSHEVHAPDKQFSDKYWEADSSDFFESRPNARRRVFPQEAAKENQTAANKTDSK